MAKIVIPGGKLVVASHNAGKVREITALIEPLGLTAISAAELKLPEPEETGATFVENAALKARASAEGSGLPSLADDSGLAVHALGGDPGIYSARWGGPNKDFRFAMERVHREMEGKADRSAHFVCVLALALPDGRVETFEGEAHGRIVWPPRGEKGFGYDPMFQPDGETRTFGEMSHEEKLPLTHRTRAFEKFLAVLR